MKTQQERLLYCVDRYVKTCMSVFDSTGNYTGPCSNPDSRDRMRAAILLLDHGGEQELLLAERFMLEQFTVGGEDFTLLSLEENLIDARRAQTRDWNIFPSNDAGYVLAAHAKRLRTPVLDKLARIARRNFSRYAGSAQQDYLPHGYNDNMPSHAACGLILGGESLDDSQAVEDGVYRLELFAEHLSRRGLASEYSSGNYLPLTIAHIARIVEHAKDPKISELARKIEEHLWADVVLHHHIPSGRNAAAQSRAYTWNSVGHADSMSCALWIAAGFPIAWNPFDALLQPRAGQVVHFGGDPWKTMSDVSTVLVKFHLPEYLLAALESRTYPYQVVGTTEAGGENGGEIVTTSWQTPDYTLSSSSGGYLDESSDEMFNTTFNRVKNPADFTGTGTLYSRMLLNDAVPGEATGVPGGENSHCRNRSLRRGVQRENLLLHVSRAHAIKDVESISLMRTAVILPAHFGGAEECWLGAQRVNNFTAQSENAAPVFLNMGRAYLALYPLALTNYGRKALIRIEQVNCYQMISYINYEGKARDFTRREMQETFNGFVCEISGPEEAGSFEQFREKWTLGCVEDWWFFGNRRTRWTHNGHELAINWLTERNVLRSRTVDGRIPESPQLAATGFNTGLLPFIAKPYLLGAKGLGDRSLDVAWQPDYRWQR